MKRRDFVKLGAVASLLPLASFINKGVEKDELMGISKPALFGDNYNLRKRASDSFIEMRKAALKDGIQLYSQSSYRSFAHQKRIWERKYTTFTGYGMSGKESIKRIIEYSTIPGTSRHHWGTDLDIIDLSVSQPFDVLNAKHFVDNGVFSRMYQWMNKYAQDFGFYETYTNDVSRLGFEYEPWHYSYAPLAKDFYKEFLKLNLASELKSIAISGTDFFTDEFVQQYINQNIKGINRELV